MISHTGNNPPSAKPFPKPTMVASLMGVLRTRPGKSSLRPLVTLNAPPRSEEHTSELQSLRHLVCRLLLAKKNSNTDERVTRLGKMLRTYRMDDIQI